MKLTTWLRTRLARAFKTRQKHQTQASRRRPAFLERLEDRSLLATLPVTFGNLNGWILNTNDGGNPPNTASASFVSGPATPPLPPGSGQLSVGSNGDGAAEFRNTTFNNTPLANLTTLSYSTFVQQDGSGGQAPYIELNVDYNDGGDQDDDRLFFEPVYQSSTYFPSNPQGPLVVGAWQTWDALNGGWWSNNSVGGATPGTGVKSLADIMAAEPAGSSLGPTANGSLRIVTGFGAPDWNNFVGNVDNVTVGVSGNNTTYDFGAPPQTVYVDDNFANPTPGQDPDGPGPAQDFGFDSFSTIQGGISGVATGGTVIVAAGTYNENVIINKALTLTGAGSGNTASDTIVNAGGNVGIDLQSGDVTVENLRVQNGSNGVYTNAAISNVALTNVASVSNTNAGFEVHNSANIQNLSLTNDNLSNNSIGFRVSTTGVVSGLVVTGGNFDNNASAGLYTNANSGSTTNQNSFTNVTIDGTTFNNNGNKGIYAEVLDHAVVKNIQVISSGTTGAAAAGIDVNLKFGTYSNLSFLNDTITNSGTGAATGNGLTIKARGDSQDSGAYQANPAHLSTLSLTGVSVSGSPVDLALGDNIVLSTVSMSGDSIDGTGRGLVIYENSDASPGQTLNIGNTTFGGTLTTYIEEGSPGTKIDATGAKFAGTAASSLTVAQAYSVVDKILDSVDVGAANAGFVRIQTGQVFVTPNSFLAPVTTAASIQRAVDAATSGDTVHVQAGTYTNNVTISKALTVVGDVDGGNHPLVTLQPAASSLALVQLTGTSFGGDNNVTLKNILYRGKNGAATTNFGIRVFSTTQFGTLTVDNSDFQNFIDVGIEVDGNATTGISAQNLVISKSSFSNNGSFGNGGDGDIDAFMYNGNASLSNLKLVGSSTVFPPHSERLGIQFRGVGNNSNGAGHLPMGTVSLSDIDISGTYETNFIAIQDYSDVPHLSFHNVSLGGGAGSGLTGTFGALLRFDGVGTGSSTVDLGNTYFRTRTVHPNFPGNDIEFAPNNYAFLRANATNTRWDTSSHVNIAANDPSLTTSELFEIEDRILHYPDALNGGQTARGFASIRSNQAYVTATVLGSSIQRAADMVPVAGTVNIATGTYTGDVNIAPESVGLAPGQVGIAKVTVTGNLTLDSSDGMGFNINGQTPGVDQDQFVVNGSVSLNGAFLATVGTRGAHDGDVIVLIQNDGADAVNGTFVSQVGMSVVPLTEGTIIPVNGVNYMITYKYNSEAMSNKFGTGNDVALIDVSNSTTPAPGTILPAVDPCDPSKMALVITGTSADDNIDVKLKGKDQIEVTIDSHGKSPKIDQMFSLASVTGHIIVYGLAGDDHITIDDKLTQEAWIFGGDGKDDLKAGGGPTLIVGGAGDDHLQGGKMRDILIGGDGKDNIRGDGAEDLVIAGSTDFDNNVAALCSITDDWTDHLTYSMLTGGPGGTVHDDGDQDDIDGQDATDVYFANTSGAKNVKDNVHSMKGETVIDTPTPMAPPPVAMAALRSATPATPTVVTTPPKTTVVKTPPKVVTPPKPVTPAKAPLKVVTPTVTTIVKKK